MRAESIPSILASEKEKIPVDVRRIARRLGIEVQDVELSPHISGKLVRKDGGFKILVNAAHSNNRRRFTIAHEIAHFVLHSELFEHEIVDNEMYRSEQVSNAYETQANNYAAELLMPKNLIYRRALELRASHKDNQILEIMAREFQVSRDAMRIRLGVVVGLQFPLEP